MKRHLTKRNKRNIFLIAGLLVILAVVGLTALSGRIATAPTILAKKVTQPDNPVVLDKAKLPSGWSEGTEYVNYPGTVYVQNTANGCYTQVGYTADTIESNSPDVDHYAQVVDSIKSKGYTVDVLDGTLTITTRDSTRDLRADRLTVVGNGTTSYQQYAYISTTDAYAQIQLSCPNEADLDGAQDALAAITFMYQ